MRKVQIIAVLTGFALLLGLSAAGARADETKQVPKESPKKVEKKKQKAHQRAHHRHYRGVITAVEQDKDGKVTSFTVALRRHHHCKHGTAVAREMKFNLDGKTRLRAHGKLKKGFDATKLAKGERVRILASGDHADKVIVKKMHTARKDQARARKVKNARATAPVK
jgi:hypothetical protein